MLHGCLGEFSQGSLYCIVVQQQDFYFFVVANYFDECFCAKYGTGGGCEGVACGERVLFVVGWLCLW